MPLSTEPPRPSNPEKPLISAPPRQPLVLPRRWDAASLTGSDTNRAAGAVILGASAIGVLAGAPMAHAQEVEASPIALDPAGGALTEALAELETRKGSMTSEELSAARRELWSAYVVSTTAELPVERSTRGETVIRELLERIEARMTVTAYDMAHPGSFQPLEGHPGYKTISESELRTLIVDALKDIPLGELPGGAALADLVRTLPNSSHLDARSLSFNELKSALGDAQKQWVEQELGPFFKKHRAEIAIAAAGGITAIRAASPEAAGLIDRVMPSIDVLSYRSSDGRYTADAELKYRDRRVFPDVDLSAGTVRTDGPLSLRAGVTGTVTVESDPQVTGALTAGARYGAERRWVDLSARLEHTGHSEVRLEGRLIDPDAGLSAHGSLGSRFGEGVARGDASGRADLTIGVDKAIKLDGGATGSLGFYGSVSSDTDGRNTDARAGLMFRLRF